MIGCWHGKLAEEFGILGNEIAAAKFVSVTKSGNS
jgi:hypothetical protein